MKVCLVANTLTYPEGGGHLWVYLNWALGLRSLGCEVVWLEAADPHLPEAERCSLLAGLKDRLTTFGLGENVALCSSSGQALTQLGKPEWLDVDEAAEADLLLNLAYDIPARVVRRFRRSVLLDIDPGLTQIWASQGAVPLAPHDLYFTIGETVGTPAARFPDLGLSWRHTPPVVALDWWPVSPASADAPFTTVSHWGDAWVEDETGSYSNTKRDGFLPFLDLPRHTRQPLELALCLGDDETERQTWVTHGWRVREAHTVASTPGDYQRYVQHSRGEFSCVKPSCIRLQNAWISDRTICYLASGKPAVVQHTGPSCVLPEAAGLFRFHDLPEAARHLDTVAADYERQCRLARALAEEHFDARKEVKKLLERALS
jgi:hypothetical protein